MGTAIYQPFRYFYFDGMDNGYVFHGLVDTDEPSESTTVLAVLSDSDDTTGISWGRAYTPNYRAFFLHYEPTVALPSTARIDWVRLDFRQRHIDPYGFVWAYDIRAFDTGGGAHYKYLGGPVRTSSNVAVVDASAPTFRSFDDGTLLRDAHAALHVYWGMFAGGQDQPGIFDSTNFPYITKTFLTVGYTEQPTVTNITPSTTTEEPRPTIQWVVGNIDEQPLTAHQIILLPTGSTDAAGHAIGDAAFDPTTGSGAGYNSGKVFIGNTTHKLEKVLTPATWHTYIRVWVGSGIYEYASLWTHQSFLLDAQTVDQPLLSITDHAASNTLQVIIVAGAHTEDLAADTIEVEYYDPESEVWVAAPIANGMVNGTGTSTFFDGLHAPGDIVSYRVRGIGTTDGAVFASPWTTATHTVGNLHQWWLRSASDYTLNRSLNDTGGLLMKTWTPTRARPNTTTWGIGARPATVVHDITKGDVHECSIWAMTQTAYNDLRALLEDGDDLVLVNPWGETWRVQPGNEVKEEVLRAAPRSGEATAIGFVRVVTVSFVEVVTP